MNNNQNPKVIGAFLIGIAMVTGAYVLSTFGEPRGVTTGALYAVADEAPPRVFISVSDDNDDGIEDWQDQFITAPAVTLEEVSKDDYIPPSTITGKLGISLMEDLIMSKGAAPISRPKEVFIADAVKDLSKIATSDQIYDVKDIIMISDTSDVAIRTYGNALAFILINESVPELKNEVILLRDYLEGEEEEDLADLITLARVYKNYRDRTLKTPVPKLFVKEHLDLINVYNALYLDIEAMTEVSADPMLPFIRFKRYEDDALGLGIALNNIYNSLVPHARVFEMNDPAIMLTDFYQTAP